ncbi:MAG: hypothetical protein IJT21_10815 [Synergistaceae bacterium]|nr:hypothetical protein [Synergistaceae bacterium]
MPRKQNEKYTIQEQLKPRTIMTAQELLNAISETEYPDYVLEIIAIVREWMNNSLEAPDNNYNGQNAFDAILSQFFDEEAMGVMNLYESLNKFEDIADLIPGHKRPEGKPDTIVVSVNPPDCENGFRVAVDYATVFNRPKCNRIWIISNTYIYDDIIRFAPHVDALAAQGIKIRFILVNAWGWVELPLSAKTATKKQFILNTEEPPKRTRRRKII